MRSSDFTNQMTLTISHEEMDDTMKILKPFEDFGLLIKGVNETNENEAKEQRGEFFGMLSVTLGASLLGNMLACKELRRTGEGRFIILLHPLANFEIQKHFQNEPKSNGVYSRNNLREIKGGTYVITLFEYKSIGTHRIAFNVNGNNITYNAALELNIF